MTESDADRAGEGARQPAPGPARNGGRGLRAAPDLARTAYVKGVELLLRRRADNGPVFMGHAEFPWLAELEAGADEIREELRPLLARAGTLPSVADIERTGDYQVDGWRAYFLRFAGRRVAAHAARFPRTDALLERVPGLYFALFSVLIGPAHIPEHRGYTKCLLRGHLPLFVPSRPSDCRFRIASETRTWETDRAFVFDDTRPHEVWHDGDEPRVLLMFDFHRPLPAPLAWAGRSAMARLARTEHFRSMRGRVERGRE